MGRGAHAAVAIASASCPVAFGTSAVAVAVDALAGCCAAGANPTLVNDCTRCGVKTSRRLLDGSHT